MAVTKDKEYEVFTNYPIKNYIEIDKNITMYLIHNNLDRYVVKELNVGLPVDFTNSWSAIKSNVAIASAITAYARIEMMKYKTLPDINVYYTDTDSIFVDK